MTRQTWTAFVSAVLFIGLAVLVAVLPVPFVAWSPGGTEDTLGAVDNQPIISVSDIATYPTEGELDLTIVSGTAADSWLSLPEALAAYWTPGRDTLPRDAVYPPGKTADQVQAQETEMMTSAQDAAIVAALRVAGQPVTQLPVVASVTVGGPSHRRLKAGDLVESIDGVPMPTREDAFRQIRTHRPGDVVQFVVLRDRVRTAVAVTSIPSNTQPGTAVIGITLEPGYSYAPRISFDLGQRLGGPSAGMIFALAIYDKITPGPLLAGRHIAGTGGIQPDGQVTAIGGIQQKIASAEKAGATAFLVPAANCADLAGLGTELSLIKVDTLSTAVEAVRSYAGGADPNTLPRCA